MLLFSAVERKSAEMVKRETGLSLSQFQDLFDSLPILRSMFEHQDTASDALYMYLLKMRSAQPNEDIGNDFNVSKMTVGRRLNSAREALEKDFIDNHINVIPIREELLHQSTAMCRGLFFSHDSENEKVVLVLDGTYIYVDKSRNYEFQRATYTDQKKRNFIKVMMCVTANGTIVYALGPYQARDNDATILQKIDSTTNAFDFLQNGDILVLDRGFRDCVRYFEDKGLQVKMPSLVQRSDKKGQLTTIEANRSRLVTAIRFVVETRNGHMKTIFKIFNKVWNPLTIPHLMTDFKICAAIINQYYPIIESNRSIANEIKNRMLNRLDIENFLSKVVKKKDFQRNIKQFQTFTNFDSLPELEDLHLIWIALGKYQIRQAESYCSQHTKSNEGSFEVFYLPQNLCQNYFAAFYSNTCEPILLLGQLNSRFRSRKHYDVFLLVNKKGCDESAVLGYCCECYNGLRTVGCCSHVMCLIWYSLYMKNRNLPNPAGFLDNYFDNNYDADGTDSDEEIAEDGSTED